jgi:hypothetical protein
MFIISDLLYKLERGVYRFHDGDRFPAGGEFDISSTICRLVVAHLDLSDYPRY